MKKRTPSLWFEGKNTIDCTIQQVAHSFENYGSHFVEVFSLMPGLTQVELVREQDDSVSIKTNEGLMKRTHISKHIDTNSVTIAFEEEYATKLVTATAQYAHTFTMQEDGVCHHLILRGVEASGFLGFFYQKFGKSNIGNSILKTYKLYFETQSNRKK